jgi:hypothetical protein
MNRTPGSEPGTGGSSDVSRRWLWFLVAGSAAVILTGMLLTFMNRRGQPAANNPSPTAATGSAERGRNARFGARRASADGGSSLSAEEIVTNKVAQFVRGRRELVGKMAAHFKVSVPEEYEQFFRLAEAGRWDELQALFKTLEKSPRLEAMWPLWQAVKETYYVVEQTHKWPAQKLLDYGQTILDSLRPDMVYVGGSDPGRFIPTLLNETSEGNNHIVLTQNAFADASYLQYARFLYADRLNALTGEDSQRAFMEYLADAQRRLQHDQQSPDEPKQLRRGEDIRVVENEGGAGNRVQVSGQTAVMAINERLLNTLMQKNPDLSFAMEESFSLPSTYATAAPLGPIMELRAPDPQNALTPDKAAQSLDYWRALAQQLSGDPEASESSETRLAWSHMATAQANLFASRNLPSEAEQTYQIAAELSPTTFQPVSQLAELLARAGRAPEANQLLDSFVARNPSQAAKVAEERQFLGALRKP